MRILVSVDIEGASGVVSLKETDEGKIDYERARRWLTADCNAVIAGVRDVDPEATFVLHDTHGADHRSLLLDDLHEAAEVVRGRPVMFYELADLQRHASAERGPGLAPLPRYDAAFLVAMHARAGTPGLLSHVLSIPRIAGVWLNGEPASESSITIALAAHFDIPTAFVSGDDLICREVSEWLGGEVETAVVKESYSRLAARCLSLPAARRRLRAAAAAAAIRVREGRARAQGYGAPVQIEVELDSPTTASFASYLPTVEWDGARRVRFAGAGIVQAYRTLCCLAWLANAAPSS
ncbi:MAG: M55 family metallopeptidase [Chloroflexota bacterium]